jgi:hypothetical protein
MRSSFLIVESGVDSGNLWVKSKDTIWLTKLLGKGVETILGSLNWWEEVSGGSVWLSSSWVGVVSWDSSWGNNIAWSSRLTVLWSIGSVAINSLAVDTVWSIGSVADWELTWLGLDDNWVPALTLLSHVLLVMELLSLHDDVLTEILISVHSSGEKLSVWNAVNTGDTSVLAVCLGLELNESSSRWLLLVPGWLVEVWWGISKFDGRGGSEKGHNSDGFHF